jgi:hypothetical protein
MTYAKHIPTTQAGVVSDVLASGCAFVDLLDGTQAFVMRSLVARMSLAPSDHLLCSLVPNFPDKATDRVPWRVVYAQITARAGVEAPATPVLATPGLDERVLEFMQGREGAWSTDALAFELDVEDPAELLSALLRLHDTGLVCRAQLRRSSNKALPTENFWAVDYDELLPEGLFEDEEDDQ